MSDWMCDRFAGGVEQIDEMTPAVWDQTFHVPQIWTILTGDIDLIQLLDDGVCGG